MAIGPESMGKKYSKFFKENKKPICYEIQDLLINFKKGINNEN